MTRFRVAILSIALGSFVFVLMSALHALSTNSNRPEDWLPEKFQETKDLYWFAEHFTGDDVLMISWEGCDTRDPRVAEVVTRLRQPLEVPGQGAVKVFRLVITGDEVLEQLTGEPLSLTPAQAQSRLSGWLLGPPLSARADISRIEPNTASERPASEGPAVDRENAEEREQTLAATNSIVATLTLEGWNVRKEMLRHLYQILEDVLSLPPEQVYIAGSTLDGLAIDAASEKNMPLFMAGCFVTCFVLMVFNFKSVWLSCLVFFNAVYCQLLILAIISWSGATMDSVMLMVPSLVFVLSVSTGVHLFNNYRDVVAAEGLEGAHHKAIAHALAPCWLSSFTTALGLISLVMSYLIPVQKFGFFATVGVLVGTALIFVLFACEVEQWPPRRWAASLSRVNQKATSEESVGGMNWINRWRREIVAVTAILMCIGSVGVYRLQSTAKIHDLFSPDAKILQDYDWLETNIGPLTPVEVVLRIPKQSLTLSESKSPALDRLNLIRHVHQDLKQIDTVGTVISATNFAPAIPETLQNTKQGLRTIAQRVALEKRMARQLPSFVAMHFLADSAKEELWRLSVRVRSGTDVDLQGLVLQLRQTVDETLQRTPYFPGVTATICGGIPLITKSQDQLLKDMTQSFISAFGLISVAMMLTLRSVIGGLLTMVSNILPTVVLFGLLGLIGIKIEIGSMMTATAAMGIAVDDTLHFVSWFRRGCRDRLSKSAALVYAHKHCSRAMIQTSIICGFGMLFFSLSGFAPIARFSWLMFTMLFVALLGDLIVLPAIISTRLGDFLVPKQPGIPSDTTTLGQESHFSQRSD